MTQGAVEFLKVATGLQEPGSRQMSAGEMAARAAVGFGALMILIRLGRRRLMGRIGPFDLVVTLLLGSTMSRGITGNAPLLPVLAACAAIVAMHWTLAAVTARSPGLARWVEGDAVPIVRDGEPLAKPMRHHVISRQDVSEALRLEGKRLNLEDVKLASLERSGNISVIPRRPHDGPRVVEVRVAEGVQTVRVELAE
jgi:uncharacterized membrane protein YcaP (DUF421 family)